MPTYRGLSVDPGDEHVGIALWERELDEWRCVEMYETNPDTYISKLWGSLMHREGPRFDWIAIESFRLRGDKAMKKVGSDFVVVKLIGFTEYLCQVIGVDFQLVSPADRAMVWEKAKSLGFQFEKDPEGHATSAVCVGLCATGWRASKFVEGDGVSRKRP